MKPHYTIVVVGSGYGGSIVASRMARAGQQVCLLERGRELHPGEYPDTLEHTRKETQIDSQDQRTGPDTGLFDVRINQDMHVLVGCGLGGGSLINANVAMEAEPRVFEDSTAWPRAIRDDIEHGQMARWYDHAREMLRPAPYPADEPNYPLPKKTQALKTCASALNKPFALLDLNVNFKTFEHQRNHVGVRQEPCIGCGNCVSGCNHNAKNTLLMNYLPDARRHGAEIFTCIAVRRLEWLDATSQWRVHFRLIDEERDRFSPTLSSRDARGAQEPLWITAEMVFLAAGTLGTTEILLRSKHHGLNLSDQVGQGFSGNGDVLAFAYNCDERIQGVGDSDQMPDRAEPTGPTITGMIDARSDTDLKHAAVIEEGSIQGALAPILPATFSSAKVLLGEKSDTNIVNSARKKALALKGWVQGAYHGAVNHTQTFLVMAHDDGKGWMRLENDRLRVVWPDVGNQPIFQSIEDQIRGASEALGATYVKNPMWADILGKRLITPHPLGGCRMAEHAAAGVVNHKGQVFSQLEGEDVYEGLYVSDGAMVPRSLGANPLLTICALSERVCDWAAKDHDFGTIDRSLRPPSLSSNQASQVGLRFTEAMEGFVAASDVELGSLEDIQVYETAAQRRNEEDSNCRALLTIEVPELNAFFESSDHEAGVIGTVHAPMLSEHPLVATAGRLNLLIDDPKRRFTKEMRYRMKLRSLEGEEFFFVGFKRIHDDPGCDLWSDTTTLFCVFHQGADDSGPIAALGVISISRKDFKTQLKTLKVQRARGRTEKAKTLAKFGRFFFGKLWDTYVGSSQQPSDPETPNQHPEALDPQP